MRQKTSFSIRYGGVSLRTGTSETPYLEICAGSAPENLVLYKRTSFPFSEFLRIAAHGTSKTPLPEFLPIGTSETPFLKFLRTQCARKPRSLLGTVCFCDESFNEYN